MKARAAFRFLRASAANFSPFKATAEALQAFGHVSTSFPDAVIASALFKIVLIWPTSEDVQASSWRPDCLLCNC